MIGYRLLRKRAQLHMPPPDIVIELEATDDQVIESYRLRGKQCNIHRVRAFCKANEAVLEDYFVLDSDKPRIWIHANSPTLCPLIQERMGGGPAGTASNDSSM
jgi:hypothetical protein